MRYLRNKWYAFDPLKGSRQARPDERKCVLVRFAPVDQHNPPVVAVGYRKNGGGDKQSPYFVTPGIGGDPTHWNDCLPEGFNFRDVDKATVNPKSEGES